MPKMATNGSQAFESDNVAVTMLHQNCGRAHFASAEEFCGEMRVDGADGPDKGDTLSVRRHFQRGLAVEVAFRLGPAAANAYQEAGPVNCRTVRTCSPVDTNAHPAPFDGFSRHIAGAGEKAAVHATVFLKAWTLGRTPVFPVHEDARVIGLAAGRVSPFAPTGPPEDGA